MEFSNKTVLAPMAGVNCTAFRLLCRKYGAGLLYTQMYDVKILLEKKKTIQDFLNIRNEESPIAVQLIGNEKDDWEKAVKAVEPFVDMIDINFGCPEEDFIRKDSGSILMNFPEKIRNIIKTCVNSAKKPITAKIRSGYDKVNVVEIATLLEQEGIKALTVHPRLGTQKYGGKADWQLIRKVKDSVKIPVIGNGDIMLPGHAKAMMEQTKCDAVMIGRAAMRNPEIFEYVNYLLEHGKNKAKYNPDSKNAKKLIKEFIFLYKKYENRLSLNEIKDHCIWLLHKTKQARSKGNIKAVKSLKDLEALTKKI